MVARVSARLTGHQAVVGISPGARYARGSAGRTALGVSRGAAAVAALGGRMDAMWRMGS